MRKLFFLLASMFLLVGCVESMAVVGTGAANGKLAQSSLQSIAGYGIKKSTGKTPLGHALNLIKKEKLLEKDESCSSSGNKKDLEICLRVKERIISNQAKIKEKEFTDKLSITSNSSLRSSIDSKSKIKYLD